MGGLVSELSEKLAGSAVREAGDLLAKGAYSAFGALKEIAPETGAKITSLLTRYSEAAEKAAGPGMNQLRETLTSIPKNEALLFQKAMEGGTGASTETAVKAARTSKLFSDVQDQFEAKGLADKANRVPNYWPREYDPSVYAPGGPRNRLLEQIAKSKKVSLDEAERLLARHTGGGAKAGHFEIPRKTDLPGYRTDLSVLPEQYNKGVHRLTSVDFFGKKDEVLNQLFRDVESETKSTLKADFARSVASTFLKRHVQGAPKGIELPTRDLESTAYSLETGYNLSLAFISHANKPMNVMFMHGFTPLAKAFVNMAKDFDGLEDTAVKAGSLMVRVIPELKRQLPSNAPLLQRIGPTILSPLNMLDRTFRVIASEAGRLAGKDYAEGLLKNPTSRYYQEKLLQLGVNPSEVIKGGGFTRDMELQAAKRTSDMTQFRNDVSALPLWWRTSLWGRLATMFKSFYFQQAKFFKDVVVKPAMQYHDWRPAAYLALVAPFAAEPFADLRTAARGQYQHRPGFDHPLDRLVDNVVQAGVLGALYEVPMGLSSPHDSFMRRMLFSNFGPVPIPAEQAASMLSTASDIIQSRHPGEMLGREAGKAAVRGVPFVGPYLYHKEFPPKKPYKGPLERGVLTEGAKKLLGGK